MSKLVFALQMNATCNAQENIDFIDEQISALNLQEPALICLPEACLAFCRNVAENQKLATEHEMWLKTFGELCLRHNVWLAIGSMPVPAPDGRYYAASILLNNDGQIVGDYHKLHLFDVTVADGTGNYHESKGTAPGQHIQVLKTPFGKIGLSICYDMRFPSLFQQLRALGAEIILVPSAFTTVTGEAHWHVLLRSRAIETQCYVIAAAQVGLHENGRQTYGHSLIVSPWGNVVSELGSGVGMIQAELDFDKLQEIRQAMPLVNHNRFLEQLV
ncbi:carbon-nitrogen hydrolase family protein [Pseudoalteromonas xiamenensis]